MPVDFKIYAHYSGWCFLHGLFGFWLVSHCMIFVWKPCLCIPAEPGYACSYERLLNAFDHKKSRRVTRSNRQASGRAHFLHKRPLGLRRSAAVSEWNVVVVVVHVVVWVVPKVQCCGPGRIWWQRPPDGVGDDITRLPVAFQNAGHMECCERTPIAVSRRSNDPMLSALSYLGFRIPRRVIEKSLVT